MFLIDVQGKACIQSLRRCRYIVSPRSNSWGSNPTHIQVDHWLQYQRREKDARASRKSPSPKPEPTNMEVMEERRDSLLTRRSAVPTPTARVYPTMRRPCALSSEREIRKENARSQIFCRRRANVHSYIPLTSFADTCSPRSGFVALLANIFPPIIRSTTVSCSRLTHEPPFSPSICSIQRHPSYLYSLVQGIFENHLVIPTKVGLRYKQA
ncbi:hypothetical protein C8J57DRAFT_137520 [Mycena rebaudengoi]|nr:hypothetical protein C8J57DRAFT_137520 [Mycena rebaudengoi]